MDLNRMSANGASANTTRPPILDGRLTVPIPEELLRLYHQGYQSLFA